MSVGKRPREKELTVAQRVLAATDPVAIPYGVFGIAGNKYIGKATAKDGTVGPRKPTRKQGLFLCNKYNAVFEGFYGGAAGGAKSDAMLMAALQFVDVPGYAALIMRRTFKMLNKRGALMDRAQSWLKHTDAHWNDNDKVWTFPSGATLTFGHMEHEKNLADYQSAEFQFIGIDEVTDFTEAMYVGIQARCRRTNETAHIPLRVRSASNPIGSGLAWVKRRFVVPVSDRTKGSIFEVEVEDRVEQRFFIPANLRDNPHIDQESYRAILLRQDPVTRKRLLDGDWDAQQKGSIFDTSYMEVISPSEVPWQRLQQVRYWDLAGTSEKDNPDACYTAGIRYGVDAVTGNDYVIDLKKLKENPTEVEAALEQVAWSDGHAVDVWIEQEPGQSGKAQIVTYQNRLSMYNVQGNLPGKQGSKEVRAKPVANKAGRRKIFVVEGEWNEDFFIDLTAFPEEGKDTVDALSGAFAVTRKNNTVTSVNRIKLQQQSRGRGSGLPKMMYAGKRVI